MEWYISQNGKASGPFGEEVIRQKIKEGELTRLDLIFRSGEKEWKTLSEESTFSDLFQQSHQQAFDDEITRDWVLLKKEVSDEGAEYKQVGPFSPQQVLKLIDAGDVQFSDFCWRKGFESWVKISEVQEFSGPLPSSSVVDESLYQQSRGGLPLDSIDEENEAESMTQMVNIEHFNHENVTGNDEGDDRTRVQANPFVAGSDKTVVQSQKVNSTDDFFNPQSKPDQKNLENTELSTPQTEPIPLNQEGFATESVMSLEHSDETEINLWSLEPPTTNPGIEVPADLTEVTEVDLPQKPSSVVKPVKKSREMTHLHLQVIDSVKKQLNKIDPEVWQWTAAVSAVVLGAIFFYLSFQSQPQVVNNDSEDEYSDQRGLEPDVVAKESAENQAVQTSLEKVVVTSNGAESVPGGNRPAEVVDVKPETMLQEPVVEVSQSAASKSQTQPVLREPAAANKLLTKKQKVYQKQTQAVRKSKHGKRKSVQPKKVDITGVQYAAGSPKAQSFFKHRDRMALFYSSLRGEVLAAEIAKEYQKLKKDKRAWGKYYRQWRKKVNRSLAREIRDFPRKQETYAYPKVIASFKRDYQSFYKYGETFDSRVRGLRQPSESSVDIQKTFSQYKKQAKRLGR